MIKSAGVLLFTVFPLNKGLVNLEACTGFSEILIQGFPILAFFLPNFFPDLYLKLMSFKTQYLTKLQSSFSCCFSIALQTFSHVEPQGINSIHKLLVSLVLSLTARQWWWWWWRWPKQRSGRWTTRRADRALAGESRVSPEWAKESLPCYIPGNDGQSLFSPSGFKVIGFKRFQCHLYLGHLLGIRIWEGVDGFTMG